MPVLLLRSFRLILIEINVITSLVYVSLSQHLIVYAMYYYFVVNDVD